jgi:hypothetical protein
VEFQTLFLPVFHEYCGSLQVLCVRPLGISNHSRDFVQAPWNSTDKRKTKRLFLLKRCRVDPGSHAGSRNGEVFISLTRFRRHRASGVRSAFHCLKGAFKGSNAKSRPAGLQGAREYLEPKWLQ